MLIEIDLNPRTALYLQIASGVRSALVNRRLAPGDQLPTGRELAQALGVNLDTVQRAYRLLADEGLVVARVGRGTRVADTIDRDQIDLRQQVHALIERAASLGITTKQLVTMIETASSS